MDPRLQLIINDTEPDDEAVPMSGGKGNAARDAFLEEMKRTETQSAKGDDSKSQGGVSGSLSVHDDMRRFLNKRASKSPMGRDSEMDNINLKLKSLNNDVQALYNTNLAHQKSLLGENADNVSVHDNRSDMMGGRSPMARSNYNFEENKSNIRASEVERKSKALAESLQNSIYNDDDQQSSVQSDYGRRQQIAKPINGSVTPAPAGGPNFDTIPSVHPVAAGHGRGTRGSNQTSENGAKRGSRNPDSYRSGNTDGAKPLNRVTDDKMAARQKQSFQPTPGEIDRESFQGSRSSNRSRRSKLGSGRQS